MIKHLKTNFALDVVEIANQLSMLFKDEIEFVKIGETEIRWDRVNKILTIYGSLTFNKTTPSATVEVIRTVIRAAGIADDISLVTEKAIRSAIATASHNPVTLDSNAENLLSLSTQELGLDNQTANRVFAGPTTGSASVPTFRILVSDDIPMLTAAKISDFDTEVSNNTDVAANTAARHTRQHSITDTHDHTSSATPDRILKADANGLPVSGTNTDLDVADAVSKKHVAVTLTANVGTILNLSGQEIDIYNQNANLFLAGPSSGSPDVPSFRSIGVDDIPDKYWILPYVGSPHIETSYGLIAYASVFANMLFGGLYVEGITYLNDAGGTEIVRVSDALYVKNGKSFNLNGVGINNVRVQGSGFTPIIRTLFDADDISFVTEKAVRFAINYAGHTITTLESTVGTALVFSMGTSQVLKFLTQAANTILAGPSTGADAKPAFRALVVADIPTLTASKISDFDTEVSNNTDVAANTSGRFKVKCSSNDTTGDYLENKIVVVAGSNTTYILELTTLNDGSDEDIKIQIDISKIDHQGLDGAGSYDHSDIDDFIDSKAQNSGLASLDSGGKVPVSQLPGGILIYKGTWNATTNAPTLADGSGTAGWAYLVDTAGTIDLGSGNITFSVGDLCIYNGAIWQKSGNTASVTSVNTYTGIVTLDADDIADGSTYAIITLVQETNFETAYSLSHARQHSITDIHDHASSATPDRILKADANGLPVDATNTNTEVAAAVTASHAKSHAITSSSDHASSATPGNILKADANGLPVDATNTDSDVADAVSKKHDAITLGTEAGANLLLLTGQEINLDTQSANIVFAGPATGSADEPAFRSLVSDDIPSLSASKISDFDTEVSNNTDVAANTTVRHARSHAITSASDHTSSATPDRILKADANGLPVDATNTNAQVSAAVTASHARSHSITDTSDHTSSATPGKILKADANGLPVDGTNTDLDVADAISKKHDAVTLNANTSLVLSLTGQDISLKSQLKNKVWAGPAASSSAVPEFRYLVEGDIPTIRWRTWNGASRTTDNTITSTINLGAGTPVRFKATAGTYRYAIVDDLTGDVHTVSGHVCSTSDDDVFEYGTPEMIVNETFIIPGSFGDTHTAGASGGVLYDLSNMPAHFKWYRGEAYIVRMDAVCLIADSTTDPTIDVEISTNNTTFNDVFSAAIDVDITERSTGTTADPTYYEINYGNYIDFSTVAGVGLDARDLQVSLTFVLL